VDVEVMVAFTPDRRTFLAWKSTGLTTAIKRLKANCACLLSRFPAPLAYGVERFDLDFHF
jgi:hypothetical protein